MHFTTRCTACGTLFWIVKDQLKVSDGWVRCGSCDQVFDATLALQDAAMPTRAPDPASAAGAAIPADALAVDPLQRSAPAEPVASAQPAPPPAAPPSPFAAVPEWPSHRADTLSDAVPVTAAGLLERRQDPFVLEQPSTGVDAPEPGFVRQARRRAFWRSAGVRATLVLLSLALSVLLAGQWALHHRDRLAASTPGLRPWLAQACEVLACQLAPVRRLESIVIDSTTLAHRLDNFYAFDIVVKNTADIPLAMPALELTLTRSDDSVMARRVFLPQELPGSPLLLPASASVPVNLRLALVAPEGAPMAGYRALVFYP